VRGRPWLRGEPVRAARVPGPPHRRRPLPRVLRGRARVRAPDPGYLLQQRLPARLRRPQARRLLQQFQLPCPHGQHRHQSCASVLHQPSQQEPHLLQLHEAGDDAPSGPGGDGVPEQHACPRGRVVQRDGRDQRQLRFGGLHRHRRAGARGVRRGECQRLRGAHQGWLPPDMQLPPGNNKAARLKTIARALGGVGAVLFLVVACLVYFVWYKHKKRKQAIASNEFMRSGSSMTSYSKDLELDGSPHIFTFEELEVATDGFSASRELGDGGFGTVYKGKLKDGRVVAVKRLYKNNYRRVEQFLNEVDILSRLLHQNLVILYGCTSRMSRDLLLVYEFIANGTVADHLHGSRSAERGLTWPLRLNIAIETAEALAYLHAVEIIHRDVKTTNILLDNSFHVKVADFGLSRLFPLEVTHVSTVPQGTPGYVDPVYHQCYKLTDKSDVYSFGVVLVELISSKPAVDMSRSHSEINLANMALNRIQNHEVVQLVDPELGYDTDPETKRTIDRVAEVAFQCLQMDRDLRPSIKEVVEILTCVRNRDCHVKSMKKQASQKEDADFLTDGLQFSPDTVIHRFHSQSTNHSGASDASGLSNMKC
uniref:non-specific serine/threonine protein kinase n=1 Tax=Aegilops tauschii subsp. strangulata TaxID=200361 RepID=A0A453DSF4_AEGTS